MSSNGTIHIAGHGIIADEQIWQSAERPKLKGGIVLYDSTLYVNMCVWCFMCRVLFHLLYVCRWADEIQALKLQADLVTLSTCSSAVGNVGNDGLAGLPRALLVAGVTSVVATLYDVRDTETKDFMLKFYHCIFLWNSDFILEFFFSLFIFWSWIFFCLTLSILNY